MDDGLFTYVDATIQVPSPCILVFVSPLCQPTIVDDMTSPSKGQIRSTKNSSKIALDSHRELHAKIVEKADFLKVVGNEKLEGSRGWLVVEGDTGPW
jgi:hypothetical protein